LKKACNFLLESPSDAANNLGPGRQADFVGSQLATWEQLGARQGSEGASQAVSPGKYSGRSADTAPGSPYLGLFFSQKRARSFLRTIIALDGAKIDVAFPNSVMETR
jgi:hypothetical protein